MSFGADMHAVWSFCGLRAAVRLNESEFHLKCRINNNNYYNNDDDNFLSNEYEKNIFANCESWSFRTPNSSRPSVSSDRDSSFVGKPWR